MKEFSRLCLPAKVYFVIGLMATIMFLISGFSFAYVAWKLVVTFLWTFVVSFICQKGYEKVSWFLVLLPYILMVLAFFGMHQISQSVRPLMRTIQLQGAYGMEAFSGNLYSAKLRKENNPST